MDQQFKTAPSRQVGSPSPSHSPPSQDQPSSPSSRRGSDQVPSASTVQNSSNPFSRQSLIAKRQSIIAQLREERGNEGKGQQTQQAHAIQSDESSAPKAESNSQPKAEHQPKADLSKSQQSAKSEPSQELLDLQRRQRDVAEAHKKVTEAKTEADKQIALAEQAKKESQAALKELEWAKNEPLEFLAKIGMKDEEWKEFLAGGGKQTMETKRMKAMEQRFADMEARHKALEERAERTAYQSRVDQENRSFEKDLSGYVLIPRLGGLPQVRNKQQQLSQASGSYISLKDAADALEKELETGLQPLLKHEDVRLKLGLADRHQSSVDKPPSGTTQNGKAAAETVSTEAKDESPKPWDWAAKKRLALKLLAQSSIGGS